MIKSDTSGLLEELQDCERSVWDALVRGDALADQNALHESFLGVYPDGFATKADHMGQLDDGPTITDYSLSDVQVIALGADHAVLTYHASFLRIGRAARENMYVSSIWKRDQQRWVNIFSQDTPAA